jgi:hypothetical protein
MNEELCIIFIFCTNTQPEFICAQMGARLRFILKNWRSPVSFFVSACKGTQNIWPILIKLRTVTYTIVANVNFVWIIVNGIYVPEAAAAVKRVLNGTRVERVTLTVVMIFNLISSTCINLKFSAAEKISDPLRLCYSQISLCRYCIFSLWWQIVTKFCIGGAYACVATFKFPHIHLGVMSD